MAWFIPSDQYAIVRFITGLGLAGELGAGITLVSELLPKEKRGIATSMVAGIGLSGAVFAYFIRVWLVSADGSGWRNCYFIGGGLGFVLLLLRVGVLESGMFKNIARTGMCARAIFSCCSPIGRRLKKYLTAILIALPNWYVIGILITFSNEFAGKMHVVGAVDPGRAIMFAYAAISIGDIAIGFISQWFKSRKKALYLFHIITVIAVVWFFHLEGAPAGTVYLVSALLGLGTGFWAMFVTMAAEQFGTNIRATVATTVPNMARGSLMLVSALFGALQSATGDYVRSGWITGIIVFCIAFVSLALTEETFGKDLNYIEE